MRHVTRYCGVITVRRPIALAVSVSARKTKRDPDVAALMRIDVIFVHSVHSSIVKSVTAWEQSSHGNQE